MAKCKPKTVLDAEAALAAKTAEVAAAKVALERLQSELSAAYTAVHAAQTEADAGLPQCRMVSVSRYSGAESGGAIYVILRRTPGGLLVVRRVGDASGLESKFKWAEHCGKYRDVEKGSWRGSSLELRDVPAEYLPAATGAA